MTILWISLLFVGGVACFATAGWLQIRELEAKKRRQNRTRASKKRVLPQQQAVAPIEVMPVSVVETRMESASGIRNPVSAWADTVGTNAQIKALANAERLARATTKAAEAEIAGIEALLKRDDRLGELQARQLFERDRRGGQLLDHKHKLELDHRRRAAETLTADRRVLEAKHQLEATKKFKPTKFALGEARYAARIADREVEAAVAKAAAIPDAKATAKRPPHELIGEIKRNIEACLADGKDTTELSTIMALLEELLSKGKS